MLNVSRCWQYHSDRSGMGCMLLVEGRTIYVWNPLYTASQAWFQSFFVHEVKPLKASHMTYAEHRTL